MSIPTVTVVENTCAIVENHTPFSALRIVDPGYLNSITPTVPILEETSVAFYSCLGIRTLTNDLALNPLSRTKTTTSGGGTKSIFLKSHS
jgi:hypothetical protein